MQPPVTLITWVYSRNRLRKKTLHTLLLK